MQLCPEHAISFDGSEIEIDRKQCNVCGKCADFCYRGALEPSLGHIIQWMKAG
ncbi:MAG: 4Fe-4S binding protein [Eubacterium ramulus]